MSGRRPREDFENGLEDGADEEPVNNEGKKERKEEPEPEYGSDYSSDDDTLGAGQKRKKKKRKKTTLLDIEAEEDEMEEEDDEEAEELREFTTAHEGEEDAGESAARAAMRLERMKRNEVLRGDDHRELERYVKERYGGEDEVYRGEEAEEGVIDQNSLAPTVRDPRLFMVRCKRPGHERRAVISLLQKHFDYARQNIDLGIYSAVCPDHLKGMIYVEALNADTVKAALMGLELFNTYKAPMPIPLDEMIDVMGVGKRAERQKKGNWVRINRAGIYKGDLAQVYSVREGGNDNQIMIRLIPRLDLKGDRDPYHLEEEENEELGLHIETSRRGRPAQKLFDKNEIFRVLGQEVLPYQDRHTGEMFEPFRGELYKHGLLYKRVSVKTLITGDKVMPTVEELEKFQMAERRMQMKLALEHGDEDLEVENNLGLDINSVSGVRKIKFFKGDAVRVVKGEQKGLTGVVEGLSRDMVNVRVPDLPEPILTSRLDLVKDFKVGEHVKVATGKQAGTVGVIVNVSNDFVTLFTDSTKEEIRVLSSNIVESSELAAESQSGRNVASPYEVFDLVELQSGRFEMGVVTRVQDGLITLLDAHDHVRQVAIKDVKSKSTARQVRALDQRGNPIAPNDHINVSFGPLRDRHGIVMHIAGSKIFFKARDEVKNCGLLVTEARNCIASTAAARKLTATLSGYNGTGYGRPMSMRRPGSVMRGTKLLNNPAHPSTIPAGTMSALSRSNGGYSAGGGGMTRRAPKDELFRRYVTIKSGPFKGYKGRVKDANEHTVRVELDSKMKTISVKRSRIALRDSTGTPYGGGRRSAQDPRLPDADYSRMGAATPAHHRSGAAGSRTPAHSQVPATPFHSLSNATPLRPFTPNAGNRTPGRFGAGSAFEMNKNPYDVGGLMPTTPSLHVPQAGSRSTGGRISDPRTTPGMNPRTPCEPEAKTPAPFDATETEDIAEGNIGGARKSYVGVGGTIPQTPAPTTPGPTLPTPNVQASAGVAPMTPGPMTPMTPAPMTPYTPGPNAGSNAGNDEKDAQDAEAAPLGYEILLDVVVLVRSRNDALGVVQEASGDGSRIVIRMLESGELLSIGGSEIQPMQPNISVQPNTPEKETIKILGGKHQGKIGLLMNTTEHEGGEHQGIVNLDGIGITMVDISLIAKRHDSGK